MKAFGHKFRTVTFLIIVLLSHAQMSKVVQIRSIQLKQYSAVTKSWFCWFILRHPTVMCRHCCEIANSTDILLISFKWTKLRIYLIIVAPRTCVKNTVQYLLTCCASCSCCNSNQFKAFLFALKKVNAPFRC